MKNCDLFKYDKEKDSIKIYSDELQCVFANKGIIVEEVELDEMKIILYVEHHNLTAKKYLEFEKYLDNLIPVFDHLKITETKFIIYLNVTEIELL